MATDLPYPDLREPIIRSLHLLRPSIERESILPGLADAARERWPYAPDHFVCSHGGIDALAMALDTIVKEGDAVAIESPAPGKVIDLLEAKGLVPLPVAVREGGPDLEDLRRAMAQNPVAFVYQPVVSFPSGHSITPPWIRAASAIIPRAVTVIELSQTVYFGEEDLSLGSVMPDQVVHIRTYSFFTGHDLRVALMSCSEAFHERVRYLLNYSIHTVSRILQGALACVLSDADTQRQIGGLVDLVVRRRDSFGAALAGHGIRLDSSRGPAVWLAVSDEVVAASRLRRNGILVQQGRFSFPRYSGEQRIILFASAITDPRNIAERVSADAFPSCESDSASEVGRMRAG
ncbi:MAG: hypothetical protein QM675_02830 [Protaetiibacter sp.]